MAFDGIVTKAVIEELNTCIVGGKINKIYEPNKNELILGIYCNGKNYALNIGISSDNYRINLTTHSKPNPINAPNFCMLLRKHLIGYKIRKIYNHDLERVIFIELEGFNELNDLVNKKLVVELMGKHSNVILLNENSIIIDTLRHANSNYREMLPAHEYILPASDKISLLKHENFEDFFKYVSTNETSTIDKTFLDHYAGFSKVFIYNILKNLNINNSSTNKEDFEKVHNYIFYILSNINTNNLSFIPIFDDNHIIKDYTIDVSDTQKTDSSLNINFFLDDYYINKEKKNEFISYRNTLLKVILDTLKKYTKKLNNINNKLKECDNMNTYKLYGELLTANLYKIKNENMSNIILENYYNNNEQLNIPLDHTILPSLNAKKYFKKYSKLKNTLQIVSKQKIETMKELDYIESLVYSLENTQDIADIEEIYYEIRKSEIFKDKFKKKDQKKKQSSLKIKKEETLTSPYKYEINDYTIFVGKNNRQNDYLTFKIAKKGDIWFHTKDVHGSHVILQTKNKEIPERILVKCAKLALRHSKARASSNIPVDYTFVKYVKKPNGAKPGMVVYTDYKTINVSPD